jgi:hypothetical protein
MQTFETHNQEPRNGEYKKRVLTRRPAPLNGDGERTHRGSNDNKTPKDQERSLHQRIDERREALQRNILTPQQNPWK